MPEETVWLSWIQWIINWPFDEAAVVAACRFHGLLQALGVLLFFEVKSADTSEGSPTSQVRFVQKPAGAYPLRRQELRELCFSAEPAERHQ